MSFSTALCGRDIPVSERDSLNELRSRDQALPGLALGGLAAAAVDGRAAPVGVLTAAAVGGLTAALGARTAALGGREPGVTRPILGRFLLALDASVDRMLADVLGRSHLI